MTCMPSADVILNASRPQMLSRAKTLPDDVFKVPPPPVLKGKGKALDIAKELEKANKAVSSARFFYFPTYLDLKRWLNVLRVIASLNMGSTKLMQTSKKSGVLYTAGLNLLWFVPVFIRRFCMLKASLQRNQMQSRAIESRAAEKFAKVHAEMYVKGTIPGASSGVQEGRNRCNSINSRSSDNG